MTLQRYLILTEKSNKQNLPPLTETKWTYQQAILRIPLTLASVVGAHLNAAAVKLLNKL